MSNTNSTNATPAIPTLQLTVRAHVRNPRTFQATEGANAGHTYYSADAELATPGSRWSTIRLSVSAPAPIVEGDYVLSIVVMDGKKGEGKATIVEAVNA